MADDELLTSEFIRHGKKQGLSEALLRDVLDHLLKNQFYPAGERASIRADLQRIIKLHLE